MKKNLRPWDGKTAHNALIRPSVAEGLLIDDEGNIWYTEADTGRVCIWCSASMLYAHVRHLNQIFAR